MLADVSFMALSGRPPGAGKRCTYREIDANNASRCRLATAKVAFSIENAHPPQMAKTWVPKSDVKSARAFAKAMRPLLNPKGNRNQGNRPR
jgi:hypothetical protein